MDPLLRHVLSELNGQVFLRFLGRLTGVRGLIPDPAFRGAGVHLTLPGGHLDLHADFNRDRFRGLRRVLTVLLYLNPGWRDSWGGHLELWSSELDRCQHRIAPAHNRLVVLTNDDETFHGHPVPLACPEGQMRQSLAAYYYVADRDEERDATAHGAIWAKAPTRDEA